MLRNGASGPEIARSSGLNIGLIRFGIGKLKYALQPVFDRPEGREFEAENQVPGPIFNQKNKFAARWGPPNIPRFFAGLGALIWDMTFGWSPGFALWPESGAQAKDQVSHRCPQAKCSHFSNAAATERRRRSRRRECKGTPARAYGLGAPCIWILYGSL